MTDKKTQFTFAALAVGAISSASGAQPVASRDVVVSWGDGVPAEAQKLKAGGDVAALFRELGAPYQALPAGDKTIYQWGQGVIKGTDQKATRTHFELLVTADANGKILDSSYKTKFSVTGPLSSVIMDPTP